MTVVDWPAATMNGSFVTATSEQAQSFTPSHSGPGTRTRVFIDRQPCAEPGTDLRVRLLVADAGGGPGAVAAEKVIPRDQVPLEDRAAGPQHVELAWPSPVTLTAGTRYFLAASATGAQAFCGFGNVPYTWRIWDQTAPGEGSWTRSGSTGWQRGCVDGCLEHGLVVFADVADRDGDGVANGDDAFPRDEDESVDTDRDGIGNNADTDDDGDAHADGEDAFPLDEDEWADADGDGTGDNADRDDDDDTVGDDADNCRLTANGDQADLDGDGAGDVCDADKDGDAVDNSVDNCDAVANTTQVDTDVDGRGDACDADDDNDGFADGEDTCPTVASASQRDSDGDGKGDACDDAFDSTDGLAAGGGWLANAGGEKIHIAYSALSRSGRVKGVGEVREGKQRVRLVDADGYWQADGRAVVVGDAITAGGEALRYRLETVDAGEPGRGRDTFELEVGTDRWAGTLAGGNLQVSR